MASLAGISAGSSLPTGASGNRFAEMTAEDFSRIIFTELSNQDPLSPNDSGALLEQLSSLRSIQSDMQLGDRLQTIVSQNELASAAGLIGKAVSGLAEDGARAVGLVESVSRTAEGVVLTLDSGRRVAMTSLDRIEPVTAPATGGSGQ